MVHQVFVLNLLVVLGALVEVLDDGLGDEGLLVDILHERSIHIARLHDVVLREGCSEAGQWLLPSIEPGDPPSGNNNVDIEDKSNTENNEDLRIDRSTIEYRDSTLNPRVFAGEVLEISREEDLLVLLDEVGVEGHDVTLLVVHREVGELVLHRGLLPVVAAILEQTASVNFI